MANFQGEAAGKPALPHGHKSILLCDDEVQDRHELAATIARAELEICEVSTPDQARELFPSRNWSLVLIHSALNPREGLRLCQWVRSQSTTPIVMLTKRSEDVDEQMAMASGADDYILKPVDGRVLLARVAQQLARGEGENEAGATLEAGPISVNVAQRSASINGITIDVTRTEFVLLEELVRNGHSLVTREQLGMLLGVSRGVGSDHVINTHLSRLRIKLSDAGLHDVISTVRGIGFRLDTSAPGH